MACSGTPLLLYLCPDRQGFLPFTFSNQHFTCVSHHPNPQPARKLLLWTPQGHISLNPFSSFGNEACRITFSSWVHFVYPVQRWLSTSSLVVAIWQDITVTVQWMALMFPQPPKSNAVAEIISVSLPTDPINTYYFLYSTLLLQGVAYSMNGECNWTHTWGRIQI
jgi:hypothetical protein